MKLVDDAKHFYKFFSIQLIALGAAIHESATWLPTFLPSIHDYLSEQTTHIVGNCVLGAAVIGRLISQKKQDA